MFGLEVQTPPEWVQRVAADPLALLADHAHCELRAAASAQTLIVKNPTRHAMVERLIELALEEMEHFRNVVGHLHRLGGELGPKKPNPYVEQLLSASATDRGDVLLDRLLVASLIEARSLERFDLLARHLPDPELAGLYRELLPSESAHRTLFVRFAGELHPAPVVERRHAELRRIEAQVVSHAPFAFRIHSGWASSP